MHLQLSMFETADTVDIKQATAIATKAGRSGTFVDNMALPIHRWFRYSAGFSAQWVEQTLTCWGITKEQVVLDPFVGSGTVSVVCDILGIPSIGIEAHPLVSRICRTKLLWETSPQKLNDFAERVLCLAHKPDQPIDDYPKLIQESYSPENLAILDALKKAWLITQDNSHESELVWLALTSILRPTSKAGTAQWQYILPSKTKKQIAEPLFAFRQQIEILKSDIRWMQNHSTKSHAKIISGDARQQVTIPSSTIDGVLTSPPYANNYDYADALRFEMTFWGDIKGWGDIHEAVRKFLIVSSSQHSSHERLQLENLLLDTFVSPIRQELRTATEHLAEVRTTHGGQKHYHTMVAAYCGDIARVLHELRRVCKPGSHMGWVIGDSAPYGVYCPIDKWIAELALEAGFTSYRFEKLRDRNIKWKNRKHQVPLKEGILWIEG